jgi:Putative phage serine protease XkdF
MPLPVSSRSDLDLCDAADYLHSQYVMRKSAGSDIDGVVAAHAEVATEMRKRSLMYEPLELRKESRTVTFADDGLTQKNKRAAKNKSGEANRTQDKFGGDVDGDTDDKNTGDANSTKKISKAAPVRIPTTWGQFQKAADEGKPTPHEFVPVRNICKVCRQGAETHVAKALGYDGSIWLGGVDERLFAPLDHSSFAKALRQFSTDERKDMADKGIALPDGSFPIPDEAHLHAAIRLIGQAPDPQSAMNHTIERAQTMGMEHALPEAWGVQPGGVPGAPVIGDGAHSLGDGPSPQTAPNAGPAKAMPGDGSAGPGAGGAGGPDPTGGPSAAGGGPGPMDAGSGGAAGAGGDNEEDLTKPIQKPNASASGLMKSAEADFDPTLPYDVIKSNSELRYTLGPVYEPDIQDAHGEWTTAADLRKAAADYVESTGGDRSIFLQHSTQVAGHWTDSVIWPTAVEARLTKSIDGVMKSEVTTFAPDTWYMGVVWEPWAWEEVKKGKITGFSMGGHAHRLEGSPA